ncbi:MAG TPA: M14 family zinc carboxypeptidase [Bryobacteraceae bacterium]|nr:M14 family zinc carboxypeptidase [Bryobacteraceae bacterium]
MRLVPVVLFLVSLSLLAQPRPGRNAAQPVDEEYTKKIREYTTESFFNSPLTDYLPASKTVPTPKAVLGDVAGAPGILPYSREVYRYMRMLEAASPRVKVFSIGKTEEGREMIAVAVADERLIAHLDENRARLAKLADPRTIHLDDAAAEELVAASTPIYYITGTIHSPETGAPTALMELAYRLAVDDSDYIKFIREHTITLITPIVEVDGRDRMVDIYRWHLANPGKEWPSLVYWGHYVGHDNNRDAMGLTLALTRNVLHTFVGWKAQVLHDLHESVPYLYDNTVGDGPYNAWIDPLLADEWQMMGWNNVSEMTKFGMPGVFTHGTFDTWSPSYLMFIAAMHNGISRLYETFGNGGADTEERTLRPNEFSRTWYKQNPPLPKAKWSQRNNNNYEETGLLTGLAYFSANGKLFLRNFYLKSKRSIEKARKEGPAAYVFTADETRRGSQADLLQMLQEQGCEISRASAPLTVLMPAKKKPPKRGAGDNQKGADASTSDSTEPGSGKPKEKPKPEPRTFPAGSYILRMDQPYSRIADALLDYQYWAPNDPQKDIYDDTGWTFGELGNVQVARVTDAKVLDAAMSLVSGPVKAPGGLDGSGDVFLINHNADSALITLRYRFAGASFDAAEEPFEAGGHKFNRGSLIVRSAAAGDLGKAAAELGVQAFAVSAAPDVKTHPVRAARIAVMHTWFGAQSDGWWRVEFDRLKIPYDYISTQTVAATPDLRAKYDVIVFPPGIRNAQAVVTGMPMYGNPLPWKVTPLTPNLGKTDETDDMRPGLGWTGVERLQEFVHKGGLLITANDSTSFAVTFGFTPGVSVGAAQRLKVTGSALRSKTVDAASPIVYGYDDNLAIFASNPPVFNVSSLVGGGGFGRRNSPEDRQRATGRGTPDDPDVPQGRPLAEIPEEPHAEAWEALPLTDEQLRNPVNVIPPAARPRVVLRYANADELLVSGLLDNGGELAQHAAVIDSPYGRGHVVLFSNNPFWRAETKGSYFLVFNAILNFDNLGAGRKLADR